MQTSILARGSQLQVSLTSIFALFLVVIVQANWVSPPLIAQEPVQETPAEPVVQSEGEAVAKDSPKTDKPESIKEPEPKADAGEKPADDSNSAEKPKKKGKPRAKSDEQKPEETAEDKKLDKENQPVEKQADSEPEMKQAETEKSSAPPSESTEAETKPGDAEKAPNEEKPEEPKKPEPPAEPARLPNIGSSDTPMIPGQPWRVHDVRRPRPAVVMPGELSTYEKPGTAPSDAIVLFDGTDLSNWTHIGPDGPDDMRVAQWKVENGYVEVVPGTGTMQTIESFGNCQLHIEWQTPGEVKGSSQGRGNSGIKIMQVYEVQVLDSFNNRSYADGYAGSMYGQYPPMVNASRKPGEWQVYDVIFEAPKFKDDGTVDEPAYLTLIHNGVLLHHRRAFYGPTGGRIIKKYNLDSPVAPLTLQDHGNPVRFRNIWIRPLDL